MKKTIMMIALATICMCLQAQKVTFFSEGFEFGVRAHIGLDENADVLQAQTDTITAIDLSGLGINDLRDVAYLPNVTWLNLSQNAIDDVGPLATLEQLHYVDLSSNALETINALTFAQSESMLVDVSDNYIDEYTFLFNTSVCQFVLEGMGAQKVKNAPFWEVSSFYADWDEEDNPFVMCRGNSNEAEGTYVALDSSHMATTMDSDSHKVELSSIPRETTEVALTNGEGSVTTYVVPPGYKWAGDGETVTLTTGLPDGYTLSHAFAGYGTVEVAGNTLQYTAPAEAVEDVVNFCYYEGETLKGFSRFYVNKDRLGDVNRNGVVDIADVVLIINHNLGHQPIGTFVPRVADVDGNNSINVNDAIRIAEYIVGKVKSLSAQETEP